MVRIWSARKTSSSRSSELIPLFRPKIPDLRDVEKYFRESRRTGALTNFGPSYREAESRLSVLLNGFPLLVSNGTVGLEVAIRGLPKSCKRIAVPDFTFAASIQAIIRAGRTPVIFPCSGESFQLSVESLRRHRTQYDAVLAVIPFGYRINPELHQYLQDLPTVWDLAGAWPTLPTHGTVVYSLHAAKGMPVGEGGIVLFRNMKDRDNGMRFITFGFDSNKFSHDSDAINGKLDDLHASILCAQLDRIEEIEDRAVRIQNLVESYQNGLNGFCVPHSQHLGRNPILGASPSMAVLKGLPAEEIVVEGLKSGFIARRYYYPMLSMQPAFKAIKQIPFNPVDRDELLSCVAFPCDVTDSEFQRVLYSVRNICRRTVAGRVNRV